MNIDCGRSAGVLAFAATASRARGAALARDVMISIGSRVRFGFLLCVALAWSQSALAICYVNAAAAGSNTGASWANAYTDLQSALANWPACVDIWVARGTYKPTTTTDRSISFAIKPSVFLYGGFAGTEASLGDRNTAANVTTLSADIGVADDASDNSYHVVVLDGTTVNGPIPSGLNVIADLTISGGNGNGAAFGANQDRGGGLFCIGSGAGHECSPALDNLVFENNQALFGGGLYNSGGSGGKSNPLITNADFRNNSAAFLGGAMYNDGATTGGTSSPTIDKATFSGNSAQNGGAIANGGAGGTASPTIRNSTFYANVAVSGGAMSNAGQNGGHASPVLRYVTFSANRATNGPGGAILNYGSSNGDAAPKISGAIFWGDQATSAPVEMATTSPTVPTLDYSISPECLPASVSCTNADPLLGALQDNDGFASTLKPGPGSPAIDTGTPATCPATDQRGVVRPQDAQCDIGAVELRAAEKHRCYVNKNAPGGVHDGQSWATAYLTIQPALANGNCQEAWVAKGEYFPNNLLDPAAFGIAPGKAIYGGFAGNETSLAQRNLAQNETILNGTGMYHVVAIDAYGAAANAGGSTRLDGFTITGGSANGPSGLTQFGGGMICNGNTGFACNPTLANLIFTNNSAVYGGALCNNGSAGMSSPRLQSVTFSNNQASTAGGAVFNVGDGGYSSPVFMAIDFNGNTAVNGGAMYNAGGSGVSSPVVIASNFAANTASYGGAVENDAAGAFFSNVTFSGNTASLEGGAVFTLDQGHAVNLRFTHSSFLGNSAKNTGGAVTNHDFSASSSARFDHVVFEANFLTSSGSGGAVANSGKAVFKDVLFARNGPANSGGAIANLGTVSGGIPDVIIDGAAFIENSATGGGAVSSSGYSGGAATMQISNATFWKNTGTSFGGAISMFAYGASSNLVVRNVTFGSNHAPSGGALSINSYDAGSPATATLSDTILWGDTASFHPEIEFVGLGTKSATIDHGIAQNGCPAGAVCSTVSSGDPLLGPLQKYGGFTPALMPDAASPAINAGVNCTSTDQRGVARPQGAACDIGSIERRSVEDHLFDDSFDY